VFFLANHGYRVVAHGRRGHGRSSQPWHGNAMYTYADELLQSMLLASIEFNIGLGIRYEPSIGANHDNDKPRPPCCRRSPSPTRSADSGPPVPADKEHRLLLGHRLCRIPNHTSAGIRALRAYIDDTSASFAQKLHPGEFRLLVIIAGSANQADEALGVLAFGNAYYDLDNSAHEKYGISPQAGAVVVLRPDGIFGFATMLKRGQDVGDYFNGVCRKDCPR
jgi:hypothetical protein